VLKAMDRMAAGFIVRTGQVVMARYSTIESLKESALLQYQIYTLQSNLIFLKLHGELMVTNSSAERLIRLPLWLGIAEQQQIRVVDVLNEVIYSLISY
jgi:dTDP-4-amino-4,6-dideoxygalactose transaminase